jgi:transcriptional regulator with XRE-family HTH domain
MNIGKYIKKAREENGWTQKKLADKLNCKQPYISALESNSTVSIEQLSKVADVLDKHIIYFMR